MKDYILMLLASLNVLFFVLMGIAGLVAGALFFDTMGDEASPEKTKKRKLLGRMVVVLAISAAWFVFAPTREILNAWLS